jgi:hypothetical protein
MTKAAPPPPPIPGKCEQCGRQLDGTKKTTQRLIHRRGPARIVCRDVEACAKRAGHKIDTPETAEAKAQHARDVKDLFQQVLKKR